VNGAANGVGPQVRKVERFRPDALAGKSRVAMHDDGHDFVLRFSRTVDVGSTQAMAGLLRPRPANGDRIDSL
jgi:hypothetical protein